jgi:hypothetical protein
MFQILMKTDCILRQLTNTIDNLDPIRHVYILKHTAWGLAWGLAATGYHWPILANKPSVRLSCFLSTGRNFSPLFHLWVTACGNTRVTSPIDWPRCMWPAGGSVQLS